MIWSNSLGWIGIDLGSEAVKLAQVRRAGAGFRLVDTLVIRRQSPWDAKLADRLEPASSAAEVQAAMALSGRFTGRRAAISLPMALCDVRHCRLEATADADCRAELQTQLAAQFGDAAVEREFDYWKVDGAAEQAGENAYSVSIPRPWSAQVVRDVASAGLIGEVLDALPMVLARAVKLSPDGNTRSPVAIVDWGSQRATFCVAVAGRPVFVRNLRDCGFANCVHAVARELSLGGEESQKLLIDYGLPSHDGSPVPDLQAVIEEVTAETVGAFAGELERTLEFLRQQKRAIAPAKVLLCGGGATVKNMQQYLGGKTETPVVGWRMTESGVSPSTTQGPLAMMAVAISLSTLPWM